MTDAEYNRRWIERLMKRTVFNEKGCFVWTGPVTVKGYVMMEHRKYKCSGHRIVYRLTHGVELKTEQLVCHRCDNRRCWNPAHMFLGDAAANNRDCGNKGRHHNSVKTHCKRGHEYTPENTYLTSTATTVMRHYLACAKIRADSAEYKQKARERQRRYRAMRRAQNNGAEA